MKVGICKVCGKYFFTKSTSKDYCSDECKEELKRQRQEEDKQLCWQCEKACGGCSWSQNFVPVEGWEAEPHMVKDEDGDIRSYRITKCPQFIKG